MRKVLIKLPRKFQTFTAMPTDVVDDFDNVIAVVPEKKFNLKSSVDKIYAVELEDGKWEYQSE